VCVCLCYVCAVPRCVLALDEVTDPQNLGALIRSFYFLRRHVATQSSYGIGAAMDVSIVVCQKNSAPLSPAVSKASSGALEALPVHSTRNMMKFLEASKANGWHVSAPL
jgi:21S rRNA (GM2251-2'-O)-methyltransferase